MLLMLISNWWAQVILLPQPGTIHMCFLTCIGFLITEKELEMKLSSRKYREELISILYFL
jgi:hypothetical protein